MAPESLDRALTRIAREVAASREALQTVARGLGELSAELSKDAPAAEAVPKERASADALTTARIRSKPLPDSVSTTQVQRPDVREAPAEEPPRRETIPLEPLDLEELSVPSPLQETGVIVDRPPALTPATGTPAVVVEKSEPIPTTVTPTGRFAKLRSDRKLRDTQTYPFGSEPPPPGTSAEAIDRAAGVADEVDRSPMASRARPVDTVDLFFGAEAEQRLEEQIQAQLAKKGEPSDKPEGEDD